MVSTPILPVPISLISIFYEYSISSIMLSSGSRLLNPICLPISHNLLASAESLRTQNNLLQFEISKLVNEIDVEGDMYLACQLWVGEDKRFTSITLRLGVELSPSSSILCFSITSGLILATLTNFILALTPSVQLRRRGKILTYLGPRVSKFAYLLIAKIFGHKMGLFTSPHNHIPLSHERWVHLILMHCHDVKIGLTLRILKPYKVNVTLIPILNTPESTH